MKKPKIPLHLRLIQGSIGKKFVIKQTKTGPVFSKFPDMGNVKPSPLQIKQRELFSKAVAFSNLILADPVQKVEWEKKLFKKKKLSNQLIQIYLKDAH
jgi:hypothetical protein